jgi:hypothetical protein
VIAHRASRIAHRARGGGVQLPQRLSGSAYYLEQPSVAPLCVPYSVAQRPRCRLGQRKKSAMSTPRFLWLQRALCEAPRPRRHRSLSGSPYGHACAFLVAVTVLSSASCASGPPDAPSVESLAQDLTLGGPRSYVCEVYCHERVNDHAKRWLSGDGGSLAVGLDRAEGESNVALRPGTLLFQRQSSSRGCRLGEVPSSARSRASRCASRA